MNEQEVRRQKLRNNIQSAIFLLAMSFLLASVGWLLGGRVGAIYAIIVTVLLALFGARLSPRMILRMYRARLLSTHHAPELHAAVHELSERAGLETIPEIYYLPSPMINAFAVGDRKTVSIALTQGMLQRLDLRELVGVLAHEISYIRHNDMWVMGLADVFSRVTGVLSVAGQFLLILNLPLLLFSETTINWFAILILMLAPTLSGLIQLALSRTREYDADRGAVQLTGDPDGLAAALAKIERYQGRLFEQIFLPGRRVPDPSLLRTHPETKERLRRLREMAYDPALAMLRDWREEEVRGPFPPFQRLVRSHPRWHANGLWY